MTVDGIDVRIDRKNIKHMHLYVKPPDGAVSVSAPLRVSDVRVERFIRVKLDWIKIHRAKFEGRPRYPERRYESGEALYLWGKRYLLQVNPGNRNSLELSGGAAVLTARPGSTVKQRDTYVREWYRALLTEEIARLLPKWEAVTGLHCDDWRTKHMTSRWGTCNIAKRRLWFNLRLAQKPVECLEYVILHELAHLRIRGHNAEFAALMDRYMPYWRDVKKKLNEQESDG
jgi:predicted metal-dependent hydrolase